MGFSREAGEYYVSLVDSNGNKSTESVNNASDLLRKAGRSLGQIASGDAFKLHDTYGFPIDLTRIMAEERGMTVDIAGYEVLMEKAKDLARAGGKGEASRVTDLSPDAISQLAPGERQTDG